jgi:hypothetical protein
LDASEDSNEKCVEASITFTLNVPSTLPANSYLLFYKTLLTQEFSEEFYEISMPYSTGTATEKAYSFRNSVEDTEFIVLKLSNPVNAGTQSFQFVNIRNAAGNSLSVNYNLQLFDLDRMIINEFLGTTPTLLTTGGIKHIDQHSADLEINPFTFFTFGNPHAQRIHFRTCEEMPKGSRILIRFKYKLSFNFTPAPTKCRVNETVPRKNLNYTHPTCR